MALLEHPVVVVTLALILHRSHCLKCAPSSPWSHNRRHAYLPFLLLPLSSSASDPTSASIFSLRVLLWSKPRSRAFRKVVALPPAPHRALNGCSTARRATMVGTKMMQTKRGRRVGRRLRVPFWLVFCWSVLLVALLLEGMSIRNRSTLSWVSFRLSLKVQSSATPLHFCDFFPFFAAFRNSKLFGSYFAKS